MRNVLYGFKKKNILVLVCKKEKRRKRKKKKQAIKRYVLNELTCPTVIYEGQVTSKSVRCK